MRNYVESLKVGDVTGYFRETIYGSGAPGSDIDAFPGQRYFDTAAQAEWVCILRTASGVTWRERGTGGGDVELQMRVSEGYIQYSTDGAVWVNVIAVEDITGEAAALVDVSGKLDKSGGTMTGALVAQNNTNYTTKQVRNVFIIADGATLPTGSNGDICLVYTP